MIPILSLSNIVQVRVNAASATSAGTDFSTGLILAPSETTEALKIRRYASAGDMLSDGFGKTDPVYLAALAYFAASPVPDRLYIATYPEARAASEILTQVLAEISDFYGVFLCDTDEAHTKALIADFPGIIERGILFFSACGSVSSATDVDGTMRQAFDSGSDRMAGIYGSDLYAAPALMGTAMGLARAYASSAFALCYQRIPGMMPTAITESEIAAIKALNGNVYITRGKSLRMMENGTVASGKRIDEVMALDRIAADLQDAAISLLTMGTGKLPQTDETSAVFINRFSSVLSGYTAAGVLATAIWRGRDVGNLTKGDVIENGFLMWADSYDLQSDADRAAHKAMPIHVALCLAGSVETLVIDVDVTI